LAKLLKTASKCIFLKSASQKSAFEEKLLFFASQKLLLLLLKSTFFPSKSLAKHLNFGPKLLLTKKCTFGPKINLTKQAISLNRPMPNSTPMYSPLYIDVNK